MLFNAFFFFFFFQDWDLLAATLYATLLSTSCVQRLDYKKAVILFC